MKRFFRVIILIGLISFGFSLALFYQDLSLNSERGAAALVQNQLADSLKERKDSRVVFFAVGDVMLDRGVEYMVNKKAEGDFKFPFFEIEKDLKEADLLFGNLEGPVSNKGRRVGSIYSFRMNPEVISGLEYAGFDILSLANNHMFDYERVALEDTMNILDQAGIEYVGAGVDEEEAFSLKIKELNNTRIGFLAYTDLGSESWRAQERTGMAWVEEDDLGRIKEDVRKAKMKVDVLFVSFHSGNEYSLEPDDFQKKLSRSCIDAGADMVLGHHPHVIQPLEHYENGWIAYSLGNFVFDQNFSEETMKGLLLEIILVNGRIKEVKSREFRSSDDFQPYFEQ